MDNACEWCGDKNTFLMLACLFAISLIVLTYFYVLARDKFSYCQSSHFWGLQEKTLMKQTEADQNNLIKELQKKVSSCVSYG